jgi:RNA-dependent RNA polymerase
MILEDRGVPPTVFMNLQDEAVREARTIHDSIDSFKNVLKSHSLGIQYGLPGILHGLKQLGFDLKGKLNADSAFLKQVRQMCMIDVLRELKHRCRIKVPGSYLLVGVPDEGPSYAAEGMENVYCLGENEIYGQYFLRHSF